MHLLQSLKHHLAFLFLTGKSRSRHPGHPSSLNVLMSPFTKVCFPPKGKVINHLLHLLVSLSPVLLLKADAPSPLRNPTAKKPLMHGKEIGLKYKWWQSILDTCTSPFLWRAKAASTAFSQPRVMVMQPTCVHVRPSPPQTPVKSLHTYMLLGCRRVSMTQ